MNQTLKLPCWGSLFKNVFTYNAYHYDMIIYDKIMRLTVLVKNKCQLCNFEGKAILGKSTTSIRLSHLLM